MYNQNGSPTITNCKFLNNTATYDGAGMANNDASPIVTNCTFSGGKSWYGTGFASRTTGETPRATFPVITNCIFENNTATYHGGAIYADAKATISGCLFANNEAGSDGGAILPGESTMITDCVFRQNVAGAYGGAISTYGTLYIKISSSVFDRNAGWRGGGIYLHDASVAITNCTFSGNTSSGLYLYSNSYPQVTNSIFWWNKRGTDASGIRFESPSSSPFEQVLITYSDVEGGCTVASNCTADDTGNLNIDPLFVDAANGNLQLQAQSPCIDTGAIETAPSKDILGNGRTDVPGVGNEVTNAADMGAYEFQP